MGVDGAMNAVIWILLMLTLVMVNDGLAVNDNNLIEFYAVCRK